MRVIGEIKGAILSINQPPHPAVWNLGFRPFYLAGAAWAVIGMALWMGQWTDIFQLRSHLNGVAWHMHEMIFGYAFAIVVGFLLTAVKTWTGQPTPSGRHLALIFYAWLAARILYLTPWSMAGIIFETLFFAIAAAGIAVPMRRSGNRQNIIFVLLLVLAALINLVFNAIVLAGSSSFPVSLDVRAIAMAGLDVLAFIVTIISGRVMPMFTRNGAPGANPKSYALLEKAALVGIFLTAFFTAANPFAAFPYLVTLIAFATAVLLFVRWFLCAPLTTWRNPILWVLHAALIWLPIGYLLRGLALANDSIPASLGIHAITVGVIGGMTLAMMTRTARGHTGRVLRASPAETVAYLLMLASAVARVLVPQFLPALYYPGVLLSALLWGAAFLLYLWVFTPWLLSARADGKDG